MNAANRELGARRAGLEQQQAKLARQIRNLLELIKDGHGGAAMAAELRDLERRQEALAADVAAAGAPEPVPVLHPNLPELYRRRVERLEASLGDPATAMAATEALRELINAIQVHPGERRGEVAIELRGDLAAFLHAAEGRESDRGSGGDAGPLNSKTAVHRVANGRVGGVLETLDAGTGFEPVTFRL